MLGSVLVLAQILNERDAIGVVRGGVFFYCLMYGLALDRRMVQSFNYVYLKSYMEAIK